MRVQPAPLCALAGDCVLHGFAGPASAQKQSLYAACSACQLLALLWGDPTSPGACCTCVQALPQPGSDASKRPALLKRDASGLHMPQSSTVTMKDVRPVQLVWKQVGERRRVFVRKWAGWGRH